MVYQLIHNLKTSSIKSQYKVIGEKKLSYINEFQLTANEAIHVNAHKQYAKIKKFLMTLKALESKKVLFFLVKVEHEHGKCKILVQEPILPNFFSS